MSENQQQGDSNLTPKKDFNSPSSPSPSNIHLMPSPIITRRNRTASTCDRAMRNPLIHGTVKSFSRSKGHGFIAPKEGGEDIFVHISDIEGEYIPLAGDEVVYRMCAIPPKFEKCQAIHVQITNLTPEVHTRWESPCFDDGHHLHK
ncbi:hypothetical protein ACKWTF_002497 [Chironomus riparius]